MRLHQGGATHLPRQRGKTVLKVCSLAACGAATQRRLACKRSHVGPPRPVGEQGRAPARRSTALIAERVRGHATCGEEAKSLRRFAAKSAMSGPARVAAKPVARLTAPPARLSVRKIAGEKPIS